MTSRTTPYLAGKPKENNSMVVKRKKAKGMYAWFRKSCTHGKAEFAEPKFPEMEQVIHRSIPEAMTPESCLVTGKT